MPKMPKGPHIKINTTPTQLKSWILHENDFTPPTHRKLNVIDISAIPDPILTKL